MAYFKTVSTKEHSHFDHCTPDNNTHKNSIILPISVQNSHAGLND